MSTGKIHTAVTIGASAGILVGSLINDNAAIVSLGSLCGILLTPDLDVDKGNISHYYLRKIHLEWLWRAIWNSYAIVMKHRSFLSHFPLISTTIRLIYLLFPVIMIRQLVARSIVSQIAVLPLWAVFAILYYYKINITEYLLYWFVGLCISDTLHYLFDIL